MSDFTPDTDVTPVLFRMDGSGEVTAVFPCEPGTNDWRTMSCYAHMGQHSSCDIGWYETTWNATEAEYASLRRELEGAPFGYRLQVCRRMHPSFRARRIAALDRS